MLDGIDYKILKIIQKHGRTRRNDLADRVGLLRPAVSERLRKLEEAGIIIGCYAKLDHHLLGKDITAFILVTVDSSKHYALFIDHIHSTEDILEYHAVTAKGTQLVKIRRENMSSLERLLAEIQSWTGIVKTTSSMVLSASKETTVLRVLKHK